MPVVDAIAIIMQDLGYEISKPLINKYMHKCRQLKKSHKLTSPNLFSKNLEEVKAGLRSSYEREKQNFSIEFANKYEAHKRKFETKMGEVEKKMQDLEAEKNSQLAKLEEEIKNAIDSKTSILLKEKQELANIQAATNKHIEDIKLQCDRDIQNVKNECNRLRTMTEIQAQKYKKELEDFEAAAKRNTEKCTGRKTLAEILRAYD